MSTLSNKRYGLLVPPDHPNYQNVNYLKRSSLRLPSAPASYSLDNYILNTNNSNNNITSDNRRLSTSSLSSPNSSRMVDIYSDLDSNTGVTRIASRDAHREQCLRKLTTDVRSNSKSKSRANSLSSISTNSIFGKENANTNSKLSLNHLSSASIERERDSMSPSNSKRRTPLLSRRESLSNFASNACTTTSSKRLSTYSISSTSSTRSASSSLKRMSNLFVAAANAVSSPSVPNADHDDAGSISSHSAKKRLSTVEGTTSQTIEVITKVKTPESIGSIEHLKLKDTTPLLPNSVSLTPFSNTASSSKDNNNYSSSAQPSIPQQQRINKKQEPKQAQTNTQQIQEQNALTANNQDLKKKASRLRLRHSISLKTLLGRGSGCNSNHGSPEKSLKHSPTNSLQTSPMKKMSFSSLRQSFLTSQSNSHHGHGHSHASAANISRRMSVDTLNLNRAEISAPIPQQATRDKLKHKLRNSSSILSINSTTSSVAASSNTVNSDGQQFKLGSCSNASTSSLSSSTHTVAIKANELDIIHKRLLLKLCNQQRIVSFGAFFDRLIRKDHTLTKAGDDAHFSEVFIEHDNEGEPLCAYKIIPFGDEQCNQLKLKEVIQELSITMSLSCVKGFVTLKAAKIVRGKYPQALLDLCTEYLEKQEQQKITQQKQKNNTQQQQQPHPQSKKFVRAMMYPDSQNYLIMKLEYGGISLEKFEVVNWTQCYNIFKGIVESLVRAEATHEFEHRDLHWGNVLIKSKSKAQCRAGSSWLTSTGDDDTTEEGDDSMVTFSDAEKVSNEVEVRLIDFALARARVGDNVMFTGLDDPNFFKGKGDYQFSIYRMMRQKLNSRSISAGSSNSVKSMHSGSSVDNDDVQTMPEFHTSSAIKWSVHEPRTNCLWFS
ncbi:unnamed protein product [Ambrosiozyma monospora]|uniref:Unnamed protein product n=1 Tax=Ambrosiozyma monospora TaxID=43982 RepID=A0A9W6YVZ5_AMBMO|nr:unnamed protein product [Ambrosiozyma monospora]